MKMKEVLQQTGLTDRAVRLYVDNGLVAPNIEENYSGRKNIEFSENDIDRLKNIALLRKIGFSIPDIKQIAEGGENTKSIIEAFIQQKQESVENDALVLEKLKSLSFDTQITMDSLCTQLSSAAENKQVPQEDLQLSKAEKMRREDYLAFAAVGLISPIIIVGGSIMIHELSHKHLIYDVEWLSIMLYLYGGWLFIIAFSLIMLFINKPKFVSEKKRKARKHLSRLLLLLNTLFAFWALGGSFYGLVFSTYSDEYTTDPNDYLVLDSCYDRYEDDIMKVFPDEIPESRVLYNKFFEKVYDTTTVYYFYQQYDFDDRFDIFAQWELYGDEFTEEVSLKESNAIETVQKGDWTVCFYVGDEEEWYEREHYIVAFAYNDITNTVRYIATFDAGSDGSYNEAYYRLLDW